MKTKPNGVKKGAGRTGLIVNEEGGGFICGLFGTHNERGFKVIYNEVTATKTNR